MEKIKDQNKSGDLLGKFVLPYCIISTIVGTIWLAKLWPISHGVGETLLSIGLSSIGGLFWPISIFLM